MGIRTRLFLVSTALVAVMALVSGFVVTRELRSFMNARIEAQLLANARAAAALLTAARGQDPAEVDREIDALGAAVGARITVIDGAGVVVADSELAPPEIAALESHADRPEVVAAFGGAIGVARRSSSTLHTEMLYVAVAAPSAGREGDAIGRGVARAAMPLSEVDRALARIRGLVMLGAGVGLAIAVVMSFFSAHLFTRSFRDLVERALKHGGRSDAASADGTSDEIGALAGSLRNMARDLETTMASLASERDRIAAILENMHEAVLALDERGRVRVSNSAARALLNVDGDPVGRALLEVAPSPALDDAVTKARAARVNVRAAPTTSLELVLGSDRRVEAYVVPTRDGVVVVLRDVTELKRLERVRKDFVANVSHELRTPISVIAANAETLMLGALNDKARAGQFVEAIVKNAERLSHLIADLLDIARIESGRMELARVPVSVAAVVERVRAALLPAVTDKRHTLDVDVDGTVQVEGDAKALEQIVTNLVDNAIKYTPRGGRISVRVHLAVERAEADDTGAPAAEREVVLLIVEDDGPGVAPEHQPRLFERFYRVDKGRAREEGGTGLGLAIVRHLAEAMGGDARVENNEPRGSRFTVTLPRAK